MEFIELFTEPIFQNSVLNINLLSIIEIVAVIIVAIILNKLSQRFIQSKIQNKKLDSEIGEKIIQLTKISGIIILLVLISMFLGIKAEFYKKILNFHLISTKQVTISIYHIFIILLIFFITHLILLGVKKVFKRQTESNHIDIGLGASIFQIIKYIIWVVAIVISLESIGVNVTILLAGSAALLVGLGMGMQHIFNDIISGIIILFERSLKVTDIVEVDGIIGKVEEIGIRTSRIVTRDNIQMIIPNSKFISDNVVNWSHNEQETRFGVEVGVAYGSDVELVKKILLECADAHDRISQTRPSFVSFKNFGESSLDFKLYFWTSDSFQVEKLQSDLRFMIDAKFREHNISIPFPQRDIHIIKAEKTEDTF